MPWRKYLPKLSWLPLAGIVIVGVLLMVRSSDSPEPMSLNQFLREVKAHHVSEAVIQSSGKTVEATVNDKSYVVEFPAEYSDELTAQLVAENVNVKTDKSNALLSFLKVIWFPVLFLLLFGATYLEPKIRSWREERSRSNSEPPEERFTDIRGADEVVNGLKELLDFLKSPERFQNAGVEVERGLVLYGESGTGKSSVARALAGEAGVPFFWLSGSGFSNKYIGEGAAFARRLVHRVKKVNGPAVVLIDEIDSVGTRRYGGDNAGSHEHATTLNELLVQLDILMKMRNVVVIATTNRPEVLDPALIRPGRLHRRLHMPLPDKLAREQILRMYIGKLTNVDPNLNYGSVVMSTFGLSGAQLMAVANQAGLAALREGKDIPVSDRHIMEGVQVVLAGDKKAKVFSDEERQIVAAHESGHVLVALLTKGAPQPHYVTIVPRGETGGSTWMSYEDDQNLITRSQAKARLRVMMGGRAAEELALEGNFSSGPAHDLRDATSLAVQMVGHWGMADFLMVPDQRGLYDDPRSDELAAAVDKLIAKALQEAKELLEQHRGQFDQLMADLVTRETLERSDLERLVITA
jgi:cell division protease FtsH